MIYYKYKINELTQYFTENLIFIPLINNKLDIWLLK